MVFFLSKIYCTLLKERLKSSQNCTEKLASGDPWGADIQNSAKKKFIEAETLAYYISPHNNIVYQF